MIYFLDSEFIEGFKKPINWLPTIGNFNKPYHSIQLISIGLVASDGREYYAISNEFNPKDADKWVKENVIAKLESYNGFERKSNKQILQDIINFVTVKKMRTGKSDPMANIYEYDYPVFYGYYADYDWVLFCSLFGTMMDLPKGFPKYCRDLKQMLDEKADALTDFNQELFTFAPATKNSEDTVDIKTWGFNSRLNLLKSHVNYPKEVNEHNALADARWNQKLHKFILSL